MRDLARGALARSPGLLVALTFHLLLFVALSCWTLARVIAAPEVSFLVTLGPAREDVVLPPTAPPVEVPAVEADAASLEAGAAEVDLGRAFQEASGDAGGEDLGGTSASLGIGGGSAGAGGGGGRGGSRSGAGGPSLASEASVRSGLDWLARHRRKDGAWGRLPGDHHRSGELASRGDSAYTGLALLCFLAADEAGEGPHRELIRRGLVWLARRVGKDGLVDGCKRYSNAVALLALAEGLTRWKDDAALRSAVERLAETVQQWQDPVGGGWRYEPQEPGDTSVTCWVILALKSAEHAGVRIHPSTWAGAARYLESVSGDERGYTMYMPGLRYADGEYDLGMCATGLFLRVLLGESPATERNERAAALCTQLAPMGGRLDRYALYYVALAMYQVGGPAWRELNPKLREGVVAAQRRGDGCERGSWADDEAWMADDAVLSTCFATLTLETYYRYLPVHDEGGAPAVGDGLTPGERLLLDAGALLARARKSGDPLELAGAEARLEEAVASIDSGARTDRRAELVQRALAGLTEVAAAQGAPDQVVARADRYLAGVKPGARPDGQVLRLRRLALTEMARARAADLIRAQDPGEPGSPAHRLAEQALRAAVLACEDEAARSTTPSAKSAALSAAGLLGDVRRRVDLVLAPGRVIAEEQRRLPPPTAPVSDEERSLVDAVALRVHRAYADAARRRDRAAFERAEADVAWLEGRGLDGRFEAADRAWWADALRASAWPRLVALLRLEDDRAVLEGIGLIRRRWPGERPGELAALERSLLLRQAQAGTITTHERGRLFDLLSAWVDAAPEGEAGTPWAFVADLLAGADRPREAERAMDRALAGSLTEEQRTQGALLRARLLRLRGHLDRAAAALSSLERLGQGDRADVRLERCALLRAEGRGAEAISRYEVITRALGVQRPAPWWDAVEGIACALLELRRGPAARDFLDGVVRRDPTFGGSPARADRFAKLMITAGASR